MTIKVGPAKVNLKGKNGEETKFTTNGKVTSSVDKVGATAEVAGVKLGLAREKTQVTAVNGVVVNGEAKTEFVVGFEVGKFEGSNAEIGVGIGGCFFLCGELEVGIQADKVMGDLTNAFSGPGPPPPSAPGPPPQ